MSIGWHLRSTILAPTVSTFAAVFNSVAICSGIESVPVSVGHLQRKSGPPEHIEPRTVDQFAKALTIRVQFIVPIGIRVERAR